MNKREFATLVALFVIAFAVGCGGDNTYSVAGGGGGGPVPGAPWPKFKHDNLNTGRVGNGGSPSATPSLVWDFTAGGNIANNAAIDVDGTIFFVASDGKIYAVNGTTGAQKWQVTMEDGGQSSPIIGADGSVYVGGGSVFYALDKTTGSEKWHFDVQAGFGNDIDSTPVLTDDGIVCVADGNGVIYGLDAATGAQLWTFTAPGFIEGAPALGSDGTVYFTTGDSTGNSFVAVDSRTGAQKWVFNADSYMEGGVAIAADGTIIFGTRNGQLYALKTDGTVKWTSPLGGTRSTPAISPNGTIYIVAADATCRALNGSTGAELWQTNIESSGICSPSIAADGTVCVGGDLLYGLNGTTGAKVWEFDGGSSFRDAIPSIGSDGTVYAGTLNGHMFAVR
ncbi:MAG: PQQ-binding-like beta-propeller repeat protein [Fimbriimonas sp.]